MIELEEKISEEQRAKELHKPINNEPVVPPSPHKSSRIFHHLERYLGILTEDVEEIFFIGDKGHGDDLKTYDETMSDIDSEKWLSAMKSEIDSMYSNQIWTLVDPPEGIVPIG